MAKVALLDDDQGVDMMLLWDRRVADKGRVGVRELVEVVRQILGE